MRLARCIAGCGGDRLLNLDRVAVASALSCPAFVVSTRTRQEDRYTLLSPRPQRQDGSSAFLLERVAQLETALGARLLIEQAQGSSPVRSTRAKPVAFETLRGTARRNRTNLRDLAAATVAQPGKAESILAYAAADSR